MSVRLQPDAGTCAALLGTRSQKSHSQFCELYEISTLPLLGTQYRLYSFPGVTLTKFQSLGGFK